MTLEEITKEFEARGEKVGALDATLKFAFEEGGTVYLDGTGDTGTVSNSEAPADCTISMKRADMEKMLKKEVDGTQLYSMGRLSIDGDFQVAMQLSEVFSG